MKCASQTRPSDISFRCVTLERLLQERRRGGVLGREASLPQRGLDAGRRIGNVAMVLVHNHHGPWLWGCLRSTSPISLFSKYF